jgi:TonB family protein
MGNSNRYLVPFLLIAPLVVAQQRESRPLRIICTPPTMKVVKMVEPTCPPGVKASGIVAVEVEIDKTGKPSNIKVLKSNPLLVGAVIQAVKQWRWKPLRLNGEAVETVITITINFEAR